MLHTILLVGHILVGTAGMVLGPVAMVQDNRRLIAGQRSLGRVNGVYRPTVLLVCLSAVGLVVENRPDLWWLVPVSALTYGLAVLARVAVTRQFRGWVHGYVHGIGGSYIALVTALIVVALTVDGPVTGVAQLVPWLAPTAIGTVLIELWRRRLDARIPVDSRPGLAPEGAAAAPSTSTATP